MPVERWTPEQVTALAPDAGSLRGARSVSGRTGWVELGAGDDVLWGLCRGSGKKPYQVVVDLSGPAYKCSCPSRKFPCKHALGLLMLWAGGEPVPSPSQPGFVTEWLSSRAARKAAPVRTPGKPADPEAAAKRLRQREERVAGGLAELGRWLDDQIQQGLAAAERAGWRPFEAMAARLVDAQAPAAASTVRRLGGMVGIGPHWADRLLGEMGLLRLLITAHGQLGDLPAHVASTVRTRIGFPIASEDVLAGPRIRDRWQVLGQVDTDDGNLMSRRIWLRGADSGRFALVLSFAAPGQNLVSDLVPGTELDADLCFYPGAYPVRALVAERYGTPVPLTAPAGAAGTGSAAAVAGAGGAGAGGAGAGGAGAGGAGSPGEALAAWSAALAAEPWRHDIPVLLGSVVPSTSGSLLASSGEALPLAPGHREPWWLLAATGAAPAVVAAEWSAAGLRPLAAWTEGQYVPAALPAPDGAPVRGPELPPDLLAAALVGTARRPWSASVIEVGGQPIRTEGASLLETAGVALLYRRAGVTAQSGAEPVSPAPAETTPPLPAAAGARLRRILTDGGVPGGAQVAGEVLAQWLELAAARGGHVPPETLPALLDAGRRNGAIRAALGQVSGRRGAWLAAMRDDWRWLLAEAPATGTTTSDEWQTGSAGERLAHLQRLRRADPPAALALLATTWAAESADDRVRFLSALEEGLSTADDEFLEAALDDRRREVREAALDLLRQLPGSALGRRMTERALAAIRVERRTFGRDRLHVDPPAELDAALRRDGVAATPVRGIGAGAWLLEEVLANTPLGTWLPAYGKNPEAVLDLARGHDWESPLRHGWAKAAIAQRDAAWAEALVDQDAGRGKDAGLREAVRWDLHLVLPPAVLARIAADFLRREDHLANRLLAVHPGDWPDELAVAVVETIARRARTDRHSWQLSELCRSAALSMPPRYAPHLAQLTAQLTGQLDQEPADPSRVRPVAELARTLTFRHEMHQEFE